MEKAIKIILAILFFLCLFDMPYGFFQLVRFCAMMGFVLLAYLSNKNGSQMEVFIWIGLAILFQPLFKIGLGRQVWNIVDVIVGLALLISIFLKNNKR
jgi:uncharacterized membrane protein YhdT